MIDHPQLEEVASWIRAADRVTALTGAGISTDSGIADFRGPKGVWTKNPGAEQKSHIRYYLSDPEVRAARWQAYLDSELNDKRPNTGHKALVELERKGKLQTLVTQNIDSLHTKAGTSEDILIEVHGTVRDVKCLQCGERAPAEKALARVRAGEADPPCRSCGGILKSATISFGQALVEADIERAMRAAEESEVLITIGTLLSVYPIAFMADEAVKSGSRLVIINAEPTSYDRYADACFHSEISEVLPRLVDLV